MTQPVQPQFQLVELSPEEGKELTGKIDALMAEYSATFTVQPFITPEGLIQSKINIFKKVELVPKGVPFPEEFLKSDGQNPTQDNGGSKPVEAK